MVSQFRQWFSEALVVVRKDVTIERATGEIVTTSGFFAILMTVLGSLAFSQGAASGVAVAPGVLWLSLTYAAVLGLGRTWYREREEGALRGLIVAPIARSAIFVGKAAFTFLFVSAIEVMVIPMAALLLGFELSRTVGGLAVLCFLANCGVAAAGTLFGALTVKTRARDLVLASVLLPLLSPVLGLATVASRELFGGASLLELADYLKLMVVFDAIFWAAGLGLFGWLLEG